MFNLLITIVASTLILLGYIYEVLVLKPKRIRKKFENQGVRGPKPSSILLGNIPQIIEIKSQLNKNNSTKNIDNVGSISHDWTSISFPHLKLWQNLYGRMFIYSTGSRQSISISDPNIIKEMTQNTSLDLGKPSYLSKERGPLFGHGVVSASGSFWQYQRKLISPEFFPDKVKGMFGMMVEATTKMCNSWEANIESKGGLIEITIDDDLRNLSQDIISKSAFGSSYSKGKDIFSKLRDLQELMAKTVYVGVPGSRFMPSMNNWQIRRVEKEINQMILKVVQERMRVKHETDFLQKMVEGARIMCTNQDDPTMKIDVEKLIVDNCKTMYFAGHETTSTSITWTLMLLAVYPEWQERARDEVIRVCQGGVPAAEDLRNMKVLTMVIQESLRLYPPAIMSTRTALQETTLNGIKVPKGVDIHVTIPIMHHDPDLWGNDVNQFNPNRFANGVGGACNAPQAYLPFGCGARVCLGQHFAMVELKIMLSIVLSKFRFSLSPSYRHSPSFRLTTEPEHGVQLLVSKV
ncbi:hypothetical protein vseg_018905 [Gypsophila vaccaria]